MPLIEPHDLRTAVHAHRGVFTCSEIHAKGRLREVPFQHVGADPVPGRKLPAIPGLRDFYAAFDELLMYVDAQSGDAAYRIASPAEWSALDAQFRPWLDPLEEAECPDWIDGCVVVGEIPRSGNYLLVPASGPFAGQVFEFEHDGYEFLALGESLPAFVLAALDLDPPRLTAIASHLRFVIPGDRRQWWIEAMDDNRGHRVRTEA